MNTASTALFLICLLAGPSLAETTGGTPETCPLAGPVEAVSEDCAARRDIYRSELQSCIDRMRDEANSKTPIGTVAPAGRARFLICAAATRKSMGLASN